MSESTEKPNVRKKVIDAVYSLLAGDASSPDPRMGLGVEVERDETNPYVTVIKSEGHMYRVRIKEFEPPKGSLSDRSRKKS